jgi:protein TonB
VGGLSEEEGGTADGTISAAPPPPPPPPARPADLAAVRAALAKALVYPSSARRLHLEGRVVVVFTLHADGSVGDLWVDQSSGVPMLDAAALDGVRRAAPFPRPDVERRLTLPVTFRLET